jgi:alkanesulfonate monooxygenase SsuD/methylene tetrahydromethanopterin reductase-like flavin-dependent oxidoreductase (luciferase family)
LASAYNTAPAELAAGRERLHGLLRSSARNPTGFPVALATMWTYLTDSEDQARAKLALLARMLNREPAVLAEQVLIGDVEVCAARLSRYAAAGVTHVFIWLLGDVAAQVDRFAASVAPALVTPRRPAADP